MILSSIADNFRKNFFRVFFFPSSHSPILLHPIIFPDDEILLYIILFSTKVANITKSYEIRLYVRDEKKKKSKTSF